MRKTTKSILSMVLSAAMVVSAGSGLTGVKAAADEEAGKKIEPAFTAYLMQNNSVIFNSETVVTDPDGSVMEGVVASPVAVDSIGTYTVSAVAEDEVENLFDEDCGVKYLGLEFAALGETEVAGQTKPNYVPPSTYSIKPKTISVTHDDGTVDTYDWSKIGDGTDNRLYNNGGTMPLTGKLRVGIVNTYASKSAAEYAYANPFLVKSANSNTWAPDNVYKINEDGTRVQAEEGVPVYAGETFSVTFEVADEAPPVIETPKPTAPPTAPPVANKYNAFLGFQTDTYVFRNVYDDEDGYGFKSTKLNYKTDVGYWGVDDQKKEKLLTAKPTIKDAEMTDNVQYTVSMSGLNLKTLKGNAADSKASTKFNMLFITTDIPQAMKGVTAKNAVLKIDGKEIGKWSVLPEKGDHVSAYYQFMISNTYAPDDGTVNCPYPAGKLLDVMPTSSIEITFTLSGVNFNQDFTKKTIGPAKNKSFTSGNFKYKVTKVATETAGKKTQGTVTLTGLTAKGKKAKKLTVGATVKEAKSGATYKINNLGSKPFKGAKKATAITLGKNIKKLPANVFSGCSKLKTLTLKAKLSSVNKKAFKGCKKAIKIAGTSKKANLKKIKKIYKKAK